MKLVVPGVLVSAIGLCEAAEPTPVSFAAGRDYFFRSDHLTSADYIKLARDGTYSEVDVEHVFTMVSDQGSWSSKENHLILLSKSVRREIRTPHYTVYVFDSVASVSCLS